MKSLTLHFVLLLVLLGTSSSFGADLVLRERATQHGAIIRLGDVADISATSVAEVKDLASTPLLPAPAPGTQQFLNVSQVRELIAARGIRLDQLTFSGAKVVEIGAATQVPKSVSERPSPQHSPQEVELRVQQAIEHHLQRSTKAERWRVEVSLNKTTLQNLAGLRGDLQVRGRSKPRSGTERLYLSTAKSKQEFAVTASLTKIQAVVVTKRPIERGQLIRKADVEIREREGNLPSKSLTDLQQVVGKEALRTLRVEEIIQKNQVRAPWQVRRGETVSVFVRTGGVVVRTRATAKENGAMGELIALETLTGKQRLDASVSGPGEATVYATGGQTTDFASLRRNDPRRR